MLEIFELCEQRQVRHHVSTLPFPRRLFDEGIVQQTLDVGLIRRYTLAARELSRKVQIGSWEPDANLLGSRFEDVRPSQFAWMV
jgi:hypothetical protein